MCGPSVFLFPTCNLCFPSGFRRYSCGFLRRSSRVANAVAHVSYCYPNLPCDVYYCFMVQIVVANVVLVVVVVVVVVVAASPPRSPPLLCCFFLRGHDRVGKTPRNTFKANARRTSTEGRYKDHLMVIACGLAEQCLSTTSPCLPRRATPLFISSVAPAASPSFVWP